MNLSDLLSDLSIPPGPRFFMECQGSRHARNFFDRNHDDHKNYSLAFYEKLALGELGSLACLAVFSTYTRPTSNFS
ncbi:hypothetical protein RCIA170 [Methanocella arvoryzae MRE50]|uniref:Uncharacterized protein n=1 Tax=Methanocella arvoryzae (strain DSM 22066 / NBRC 105507 / MRE50) TaxID=351160 RepID=Q0W2C9_METAR|nr:hypothetical protein RCIA170 [Methanocella arvoryzae MRE50]